MERSSLLGPLLSYVENEGFWKWIRFFIKMEQHDLKFANNCLNTNIYSYLETSGACVIKLFTAVIDYRGN
jgi:hypothetical protein